VTVARRCQIADVLRAHVRAARRDRSVQPPEDLIASELRCTGKQRAVRAAIAEGVMRRGMRGLYIPKELDPGAARVFRKGARGQLAGRRRR
jgi:hypothetical protein